MRHPAEFWQAILAHPHDDAPRLVYADWLEEQGDPLAEFIRLQCCLARVPEGARPAAGLEAREVALWAVHERRWAAAVADKVDWWGFRRGFVEEVSLTAGQLARHGEALFRSAPLQDLHLDPTDGALDRLPALPVLGHTVFVDLSACPLGDEGLARLAASPFLAQVHGLNLSSCSVSDAGVQALCEAPGADALRELYLCDNAVSDAGVRVLAMSPLLERLDTLFLRANPVSAEGADLLRRVLGDRVRVDPDDAV